MIYYLALPLIPLLVYLWCAGRGRRRPLGIVLCVVNASALIVLVYFICLGMYFQNYYAGPPFERYPSLVISRWWVVVVGLLVVPLDLIALAAYLLRRRRRPRER